MSCKRLKHESGAIDWVHNKLKKSGALPEDFNLQQCFFGEDLLALYQDKSVAIVESEKSAIIASALIPNLIWLAAGNINGFFVVTQLIWGKIETKQYLPLRELPELLPSI
jgi:hypothetical protein